MTSLNDAVLAYSNALAWPIVVTIAIFVSTIIFRKEIRGIRGAARTPVLRGQVRPRAENGELDSILNGAVSLNGQHSRQEVQPAVHLATALRVSATDFRSSALEIGKSLRAGTVTIVDFAQLETQDARRLADFCGGLACHSAAWIFRPSSTVLILTPPSQA